MARCWSRRGRSALRAARVDPVAGHAGVVDDDGGTTEDETPSTELRRAADLAEVVGLDPARFDRSEVLDKVGLEGTQTRRWWRAMGLVEAPDGVTAFGYDDVAMAKSLKIVLAQDDVAEDDIFRLARLLGGSFSRISEAQADVIDDLVTRRLDMPADTPADRLAALQSPEAGLMLDLLEKALLYVWRRHLHAALGRWVGADPEHEDRAVGFADISGFSAMSKRLDPDVLGTIVERFESEAVDVVSTHDGRVVKFIGDEALFVVDDLGVAADVALELAERMRAADPPVSLHCGLAHGPTVTIGGDVFGNTVNLAKRLTDVARRNKVVATRDDASALSEREDLRVSRVRRPYELKGIGRSQLVNIARRTPSG